MFEEESNDSFSLDKVVQFERMIENDSFSFFDVEDYEVIINYYLDIEFKDKARLAVVKGLIQHPKNLSLSLILAEFYSLEKLYLKGIDLLNGILTINPSNRELLMALGRLNSRQGYYKIAANHFTEVFYSSWDCLEEETEGLLMELAYEFQNMGNCEMAIDVMQDLLLINPNNESTLLELGVAYNEVDRDSEALLFFNELVNETPYSYLAWFNLGTIYNRLSYPDESIFAFDLSIAINENFSASYYGKANVHIQKKEYRKAIDLFNETFKIEQPHSYAYCTIGECYEKIGEYDNALTFYEKSIELDSNQTDAWVGIGVVKDLKNQSIDAIKFIEKALKFDPENAEYWYIYAEILQKLLRTNDAENAFKKVVELEPNNVDAWIDYSNFLFENNAPKKAISTVRTAIKNNGEEEDLSFRLIALLLADNKLNEASIKLHHILRKDKKTITKLFEIYPQARDIQEIVDIIAQYKD